MSSPIDMKELKPQQVIKFPHYITEWCWTDDPDIKLDDAEEDFFFANLFKANQRFDWKHALQFTEEKFLNRNLSTITSEDFIKFIKQLHERSARSLLAMTRITSGVNTLKAGEFVKIACMLVNEDFVSILSPDGVLKNYQIIEKKYGTREANNYKEFCHLLDSKIAERRSNGTSDNVGFYELIIGSGLDKHVGYATFMKTVTFGSIPANFEKELSQLWEETKKKTVIIRETKGAEKQKLAMECAAYFLYKFGAIHPFPNGTGHVARIIMNCILMQLGENPIPFHPMQISEYYKAYEKSKNNDVRPLVAFFKKAATDMENKEEGFPSGKEFLDFYTKLRLKLSGKDVEAANMVFLDEKQSCITLENRQIIVDIGPLILMLMYSALKGKDPDPLDISEYVIKEFEVDYCDRLAKSKKLKDTVSKQELASIFSQLKINTASSAASSHSSASSSSSVSSEAKMQNPVTRAANSEKISILQNQTATFFKGKSTNATWKEYPKDLVKGKYAGHQLKFFTMPADQSELARAFLENLQKTGFAAEFRTTNSNKPSLIIDLTASKI